MDLQTIVAERVTLGEELEAARQVVRELEGKLEGLSFEARAGAPGADARLDESEAALAQGRQVVARLEQAVRGAEAAEARARADELEQASRRLRVKAEESAAVRRQLARDFDAALGKAVAAARALQESAAEVHQALRGLGDIRNFKRQADDALHSALHHAFADVFAYDEHRMPAVPPARAKALGDLEATLARDFGFAAKGGA
jgi:hypothetical protein